MNSLMGFKSFREKPLQERKQLQKVDLSNWRGANEDISASKKKTLLRTLAKKLSQHDWWYSMSDDGRAWDKGRKQADEIHDLVSQLGDEGKQLYKKYGKKAGVFEEKEKAEKKRTKKQKEEDDELVDVKPKIKETIDYMNPRNWFCEMSGVTPTGSSSDQRMRDIKRQRTI
jgi:hypothetical protein